ncbi:hypothetical protein L3Q82_012306, partial [Scortum barcoo]
GIYSIALDCEMFVFFHLNPVCPFTQRAVAALDNEETRIQIQRRGHKGILTMDQGSKMETLTTIKATYTAHKSSGVRLRGIRGELLEKHIAQMISKKSEYFFQPCQLQRLISSCFNSEELHAERNPPTSKTDFCSTMQKDFCVEGFVPLTPETTQGSVHDYKTDQAVTFWSENFQRIQGVTTIQTPKAPFRKSAQFSTPISERLDEIELPPDN